MKRVHPALPAGRRLCIPAIGVALSTLCLQAFAHPGHAVDSLEALHWHASDLFGLAIVIGLGVGALWLSRR